MNDAIEIRLGARIKQLREAAGLTQNDLAALSLKAVETISNFERGKTVPSVRTLSLLTDKLDRPLSDFFSTEAPQPHAVDPVVNALANKSKLLDDRDKLLLVGFVDLLVSNSRR